MIIRLFTMPSSFIFQRCGSPVWCHPRDILELNRLSQRADEEAFKKRRRRSGCPDRKITEP
jgi:hypothetical protein